MTRAGLIEAPKRATMSHEMQAAMELDRLEVEHARKIDQRIADELRASWHQRRVDELRPLVAEFGAAAVVRITRRSDPTFELPAELLDEEGTE